MISFSPHIAIGVKEYDKALDFYENTLGLKLQKRANDESEFRCGDVTYYIERNEKEQVTWLEFKVDNIEKLKVELEKSGCILSTTHLKKSYLVVDPYGMRFHIWEDSAE